MTKFYGATIVTTETKSSLATPLTTLIINLFYSSDIYMHYYFFSCDRLMTFSAILCIHFNDYRLILFGDSTPVKVSFIISGAATLKGIFL